MKVNVEDVVNMMKFCQSLNSKDLSEIEWYLNGKKELVALEDIENFDMIGLNNTDFVSWYFGDKIESAGLQRIGISILNGYKKDN